MSKLIQIRQRIKAIETIKKVTHAMRLISMSTHSRLRGKQEPLRTYRASINQLFAKLQPLALDWTNPIMYPTTHETTLFILVGSQKGLCGTFNTHLFAKFIHTAEQDKSAHYQVITIGKQITDFYVEHYHQQPIKIFNDFSQRTMASIADALINYIVQAPQPFARVAVVSNEFTGFFIQRPRETNVIPFNDARPADTSKGETASGSAASASSEGSLDRKFVSGPIEGYLWYHEVKAILDMLAQQYLEAELQSLLYESLLAEHAARFISMDNATRNAEKLLEETKSDYNKLRQAKITKELTELTSSFSLHS
jgi:F-type H+-transporting ATPase subunit gamma